MQRRTWLKWVSRWLGAACAAVVALPGISFVLEALRRDATGGDLVRRVARLKDLPVGKPVPVPVVGSRRDAWTIHPDEVLGRIWLIRGKLAASEAGATAEQVAAFTAVCPHLGCLIHHDSKAGRFHCPCHQAAFGYDGARLKAKELGRDNHAPRDMDSLQCQLVTDDAGETWVEVTFQKFEQGLSKKVAKS